MNAKYLVLSGVVEGIVLFVWGAMVKNFAPGAEAAEAS
jgi:hypothetical protein